MILQTLLLSFSYLCPHELWNWCIKSGKSLPYRLLFWSCGCRAINVRKLSEGFYGRGWWHLYTKSLNCFYPTALTLSDFSSSPASRRMPRVSGQGCLCRLWGALAVKSSLSLWHSVLAQDQTGFGADRSCLLEIISYYGAFLCFSILPTS